ncbi:MAG: type II toxin-antitoxin system prevent-host-death family antitoxin [Proteobacteria bacterium]|nr:type II toxin-antitoxin system prevent-host-death family antitoxin [Pseudomonadota bacterium]
MDAITYTQARKNFTRSMNRVCEDHAPLIITRQNAQPVVMLSLEDYNALEETLYLLRSPRNAQRLLSSIERLEKGEFLKKELIED